MYRIASAALVAGGISLAMLAPAGADVNPNEQVDVAFVLDTTGSMADLIDGAKTKIWSIADEIRKNRPNARIRFALIGYRDRGDDYVTDVTDLTGDLQTVYAKLLGYQAAGGGDDPESVNEALNAAISRLGWTDGGNARRLVFLVGDAPPHMDYAQDVPFTASLELAAEKSIIVNAVQAGDAADTELAWRSIAAIGKGDYIKIPQSGNMQVIETPFDQEIKELQLKLNLTVVPYGSGEDQQRVERKLRLKSEASPSASADMAGYENRAAQPADRVVVTDENDLVNRVIDGSLDYKTLPAEALSKPMQSMGAAEQEAYLKEKVAERQALQSEVMELIGKRDDYLTSAPVASSDSFDGEVKDILVEQLN